nr:MAG TPA: hypothetical protein [Caudoviricetes sp.]
MKQRIIGVVIRLLFYPNPYQNLQMLPYTIPKK